MNNGFTVDQAKRECIRKFFTKNEALDKRGELIVARPIQGVGTLSNVLLSPWMNAFVAKLHQNWSVDCKLTYSCGFKPEDIGDWYSYQVQKVQSGTHFLFENDYTQYDSSISVEALKTEFSIYQRFGIDVTDIPIPLSKPPTHSNWAEWVLFEQLNTVGFDKYDNKYEVTGNRKSGDPNTSCGNSLVNGIANAYVFAKELARVNGVDVLQVSFDDLQMDF